MKGVGRKISGAFKKITGSNSSCSRGWSSSRHSPKPTPTPTTTDYEQDEPMEEQASEPQAEDMEIVDEDAPYLDLQNYRERQAYAMIKR